MQNGKLHVDTAICRGSIYNHHRKSMPLRPGLVHEMKHHLHSKAERRRLDVLNNQPVHNLFMVADERDQKGFQRQEFEGNILSLVLANVPVKRLEEIVCTVRHDYKRAVLRYNGL